MNGLLNLIIHFKLKKIILIYNDIETFAVFNENSSY